MGRVKNYAEPSAIADLPPWGRRLPVAEHMWWVCPNFFGSFACPEQQKPEWSGAQWRWAYVVLRHSTAFHSGLCFKYQLYLTRL